MKSRDQLSQKRDPSDISDLVPLVRYAVILANKYPNALSHKDLAAIAHVSKAAVSKVRDRLYAVCDDRWLGRRRRLLLRTDTESAVKIFSTFLFAGQLRSLIKSPYGKAVVAKWVEGYYRKIGKSLPELREFFGADDAIFVSDLLATAVADSVAHVDFTTLDKLDPAEAQSAIIGYIVTIMNGLGPNLQRGIKDKATLERTLTIRDKAWFFLLRAIDTKLEVVFKDFLEQVSDNQTRNAYLSMYRQTVVFYLKRAVFEYITQPIRVAAEKRKVRFEEDYIELGHFFRPTLSTDYAGDGSLGQVGEARLERAPA
jgi:hypothetical protein